MENKMEIGRRYLIESTVGRKDTASHLGSGTLDVYATPAMIALMEQSAMLAVAGILPPEDTTVGVAIEINHLRATALGKTITSEAELVHIEGRKLVFKVEAKDEQGVIGSGTHTRFIVNCKRFMNKVEGRKDDN